MTDLLPEGDELLPIQPLKPIPPKPPIVDMEKCELCEVVKPTTEMRNISRCCCWSNNVCIECINTKSLLEFWTGLVEE